MRGSFAFRVGGTAALLGVLVAGCTTRPASPPAPALPSLTPGPQIAAVVNGKPISKDQFDRELARWNAGLVALGLPVADAAGKQKVLDMLIDDELMRQAAAKQGITVSDDEVNAAINQMVQENGQDAFNGWLQANYYTPDEFREVMRTQLLSNKLTAPIDASVPSTANQAHARHILVNSQADAQLVLSKLQAGQDFAALAAQYSVDVTTKNNGGDLGWFPRGGLLIPEVDAAVFSQQPGQTSGIIATACCGFDIVQTLEFGSKPIDTETRQRLIQKAVDDWRKGLRSGAAIQQMISFTSS